MQQLRIGNYHSRVQNTVSNIGFALLAQMIGAISGILLPRIIIPQYGSDVNGLIASVTQFISYISLLEAGVGSVFQASLYRPLAQNNVEKVSGIIRAQKAFYRRLGIIFILYVLGLCIFYPMLVISSVDKGYIIALILILSVGTFIEYFVSLPYQCLIQADQAVRIIYLSTICFTVLNLLATFILALLQVDVIFIKAVTCILALIKPITYVVYVKRHYRINASCEPDYSAISQRWNGMTHHIAFYVHNNTDVILLSLFAGTQAVSVYTVYLAIVCGIERIVSSISNGIIASIGNLVVSEDDNQLRRVFSLFEFIQSAMITMLFTITGIALMPFIRIYTMEMKDTNYIVPAFGYILVLAETIYCVRCIYSMLSRAANRFRETQICAVLECATNLAISLILVVVLNSSEQKLIGLACGTLMGMTVRLISESRYVYRYILKQKMWQSLRLVVVNLAVAGCSIVICGVAAPFREVDLLHWVIDASRVSVIVLLVASMFYLVFYKKIVCQICGEIAKKLKK